MGFPPKRETSLYRLSTIIAVKSRKAKRRSFTSGTSTESRYRDLYKTEGMRETFWSIEVGEEYAVNACVESCATWMFTEGHIAAGTAL